MRSLVLGSIPKGRGKSKRFTAALFRSGPPTTFIERQCMEWTTGSQTDALRVLQAGMLHALALVF
jgi:hypothetical protein